MKQIVKRQWIEPDAAYVEVTVNPNWNHGKGWVDIRCFVRDPRKAQYHKPKYWVRGSMHGPRSCEWTRKRFYAGYNKFYAVAIEICKELGLTSSVSRATA